MSDPRRAALALDAAPHGSVHVAVGSLGRRERGTEMVGQVPTAGFHPLFWLHHCNVDRAYESYLQTPAGRGAEAAFYANRFLDGREAGFPDGQWGRCEPSVVSAHSTPPRRVNSACGRSCE
mmetsp:Transcript_33342/g.107113  ORF Transcript_33342/g.107113 Transcript_33342/m.107113 type:complete len:121 (+) Transcript_33342:1027-1389(+)